jgi:hypothetical protein
MNTLNPMNEKEEVTPQVGSEQKASEISNEQNVIPSEEVVNDPKTSSQKEEEKSSEVEIVKEVEENESVVVVLENAETDATEMTKQELCDQLKSLLETDDLTTIKTKVDAIKQLFYKKSKQQTEKERAEFIANGGNELDFIPSPTELEDEFKELLSEYKNKKAKKMAQQEKEKEDNLLKKNHIIEQIQNLAESKEDVSANIAIFRQLQQDWKATGQVPAQHMNDVWRRYNLSQEAFWDLIKINNELREYDFKKNLETKNRLCEIAETLDEEKDVVSAFRTLQKLHEEWHELGPVARELREELWGRFKAASATINKKHQSHFELIREIEEKNYQLKIALCDKLEALDYSKLSSFKEWDEMTKQVLDLQEEWRQIGFAPKKHNQKIFDKYRNLCDTFFKTKADFFKDLKASFSNNLDKKIELCEKVETLKNSTNWKETTDLMIQYQKEWKTIGPVPKKFSDEIWKRFISACDYFFEQKNKNVSDKRGGELQNLDLKKVVIEKIKNFKKEENPSQSLAALKALAAEWNSIGHVPFKDKDKLYKEYRTALDAQFDSLNISASQRRLESFKSNLKEMSEKGENKLYREREKLVRAYEHLKSEIATYENNIGFLSISSKRGGGMIQEMERKIETLREECTVLEKKINLIDEKI